MKISTVPFSNVLVEHQDSFIKRTALRDDRLPPVGVNHRQDSSQKPVRPVVNGLGMGLEFSVDKDTGVTIIKVLDTETGEVVRQIPPEEVLTFMRQFEKNGPLLSRWL